METFIDEISGSAPSKPATRASDKAKVTVEKIQTDTERAQIETERAKLKLAQEKAKLSKQEAAEVRKTAAAIGTAARVEPDAEIEDTPALRVQYTRQIREYETSFADVIHAIKPRTGTAAELSVILMQYQDQMAVHRASAAFVSGIPTLLTSIENLNEQFAYLTPGVSVKGVTDKWKKSYDSTETLRNAVRELEILYSPYFKMRPELVVAGAIGGMFSAQIAENKLAPAEVREANAGVDELYPEL